MISTCSSGNMRALRGCAVRRFAAIAQEKKKKRGRGEEIERRQMVPAQVKYAS